MVNRAFDKVRQASRGMPAVLIRLIDSLYSIVQEATSAEQRQTLARQAKMILLNAEESVPDPNDREDIRVRYQRLHRELEPDAEDVSDLAP
jgi:uncharacterized membrane protein